MIFINLNKVLGQAFKFFGISGIGWSIDIIIFTLLTSLADVNSLIANIISAGIAITFVYIASTRKMFINKKNSLGLEKKYVLYVIYQIIVILLSSLLISILANDVFIIVNDNFTSTSDITIINLKHSAIIAKIIITPFTMIINFAFMKLLIEKV